MAVVVSNLAGFIPDTEPAVIVEAGDRGRRVIRGITLRNKGGTAVDFTLQLIYRDESLDEVPIERKTGTIPADDEWIWGTLGAVMMLMPGQRYEIVLDSAPDEPVHYVVDLGDAT